MKFKRARRRNRVRRVAVACGVGVLIVAVVVGVSLPGPEPEKPSPSGVGVTLTPESGRPFLPSSPFNTPIGQHVQIDPRSMDVVRNLSGLGYALLGLGEDVPPVYDANAETPRVRMTCLEKDWGKCDLENGSVPLPKGAVPSTGSDRNMVVIDWSTRRVYEFWKLNKNMRTVSWGAVLPLDGSGTGNGHKDPGRYGAVGAGVSRLAGVVRTFEITSGRIDHALVGASGFSCKRVFRYPAVKTDGWATGKDCVPLGARVQLDPDLVCAKLPAIKAWEIPVCIALQEYGWYNIDNGNVGEPVFTIQFENPAGEKDPYPDLRMRDHRSLEAIPLDRLRVLRSWNSHE